MDLRLQQLTAWVSAILQREDISITPASADASFRRYFRVSFDGQTRIIMDAPPDKEDSHPFVQVAGSLEQIGVNAPRVLAENFEQGFFLLTDLGNTQYLQVLNENNADELYQAAMASLLMIQSRGNQYAGSLPPYDRTLLLNEMKLFPDWYLGKHLQRTLTPIQQAVLDSVFDLLIDSALQQPKVFVHRDYHSRNLMYLEDAASNPGILDFQDAVYGPVTYDLVSLLRDCYIGWPNEQVIQWVRDYLAGLHARDMLTDIDDAQFIRWFDLMGVQRHLKASGIFARLNYRDHKPGYLNDIPHTLGYILSVCPAYPELHDFMQLLHELDIPNIIAQGRAASAQ